MLCGDHKGRENAYDDRSKAADGQGRDTVFQTQPFPGRDPEEYKEEERQEDSVYQRSRKLSSDDLEDPGLPWARSSGISMFGQNLMFQKRAGCHRPSQPLERRLQYRRLLLWIMRGRETGSTM